MAAGLVGDHQSAQTRNGALIASLVVQLGDRYRTGQLTRDQFVAGLVQTDLLGHQAAVRLASQYVQQSRDAAGADGVLVEAEFDAGASLGRAVGAVRDLEQARVADPDVGRDWAGEFARIVAQAAVTADRWAKDAGRQTVVESAEASGRRWRRVSDGNPCAFCAMLVGRGPVYRSEDSASGVVGRASGYGTASYKATGAVSYGGKIGRGARKG